MTDQTTEFERSTDAQRRSGADLLAQPWYALGPTWATSDYAGTVILAGNEDPHLGTAVCDTYNMLAEELCLETARKVADHIIRLHNASLAR